MARLAIIQDWKGYLTVEDISLIAVFSKDFPFPFVYFLDEEALGQDSIGYLLSNKPIMEKMRVRRFYEALEAEGLYEGAV